MHWLPWYINQNRSLPNLSRYLTNCYWLPSYLPKAKYTFKNVGLKRHVSRNTTAGICAIIRNHKAFPTTPSLLFWTRLISNSSPFVRPTRINQTYIELRDDLHRRPSTHVRVSSILSTVGTKLTSIFRSAMFGPVLGLMLQGFVNEILADMFVWDIYLF